jgi:hypothetical protein
MKSTGMPLYKHSLESLNICIICVPTSQKSTYAQFKILKNQCYLCAEILKNGTLKKWHSCCLLISYFIFRREAAARGIVAEPPKREMAERT